MTEQETNASMFWEPGKPKPSAQNLIRLERQEKVEGSGSTIVYNYQMGLSIPQQKLRLPVYKFRTQILYLLEKYQTVVVMGQTGCGKSTQIPQVTILLCSTFMRLVGLKKAI
ncbi:putative ATP-dependent RNA helicase DHX35 [Thelohanellus kitauei]|uniref:Putative ATP-dependent RNA helicase DHX35 n=1 Tax=Thelohanellus kitauei TaxID=669202 RepID=A0A0C2MML6_THEKT|nr:putative ATP-dependent RNA helicase DHX35 [Thelohanellus kitauei]